MDAEIRVLRAKARQLGLTLRTHGTRFSDTYSLWRSCSAEDVSELEEIASEFGCTLKPSQRRDMVFRASPAGIAAYLRRMTMDPLQDKAHAPDRTPPPG